MSQDELHEMAIKDTPTPVDIPNTWQGLIVWAVARFGVGIIVAGVFAYATKEVYSDMRSDRVQLLDAYKENTNAIRDFSSEIEIMTNSINEAHRRATK